MPKCFISRSICRLPMVHIKACLRTNDRENQSGISTPTRSGRPRELTSIRAAVDAMDSPARLGKGGQCRNGLAADSARANVRLVACVWRAIGSIPRSDDMGACRYTAARVCWGPGTRSHRRRTCADLQRREIARQDPNCWNQSKPNVGTVWRSRPRRSRMAPNASATPQSQRVCWL